MGLSSLSVGLRIALVVATFPTVMAIAVGLAVPWVMDHAAFTSYRERTHIQTGLLARSAAVGLEFDDPAFVLTVLNQLEADPEAISARVMDSSGREVAAWARGPDSNPPDRYRVVVRRPVPAPMSPGTLELIVEASSLRATNQRTTTLAFVAALAVFCGGLLLSLLVGRLLGRRLGRLAQAADLVADGALDEARARLVTDVPTTREGAQGDEVTKLAGHLDRMIVDLADKMQRLDANQVQIEQQAVELREALEIAHRASLAKSQFLAAMSHELRTPMNGVLGAAQLLHASRLGPDASELVQIMLDSGEALLTLLDDLLDLSKIEAGKMTLEELSFGLNDVLEATVALFTPKAEQKGVVVRSEIAVGDWCWMLGDPHRIRQIVGNLVGNAVKFTSDGEVVVAAWRTDGDRVRIEVRDTGPGIAPDAQRRLFQNFTQADASTTRKFGGSGLGLSICRQLVQLMGGEIGLTSTLGEGSTFWIELPFRPGGEHLEEVSVLTGGTIPRSTILVVEDNAVSRTIAERMLQRLGQDVLLAIDGSEGVQAVARGGIDLVLMDCQMPVLDGPDATRAIRQLPAPLCSVPVVALTANAFAEDRERCIASGMDDFLSKPLRADELRSALERMLDVSSLRRRTG